jgi:hypothetical protein
VGVGGIGSHSVINKMLYVHCLINPVSPLMGGGSEGEAVGMAIWNVMG